MENEKKEKKLTREQAITLAAGVVIFVAGFYSGLKFSSFVRKMALDVVYF